MVPSCPPLPHRGRPSTRGVLPRRMFFAAPNPNPAHESTSFRFGLPHGEPMSLRIYDASFLDWWRTELRALGARVTSPLPG